MKVITIITHFIFVLFMLSHCSILYKENFLVHVERNVWMVLLMWNELKIWRQVTMNDLWKWNKTTTAEMRHEHCYWSWINNLHVWTIQLNPNHNHKKKSYYWLQAFNVRFNLIKYPKVDQILNYIIKSKYFDSGRLIWWVDYTIENINLY